VCRSTATIDVRLNQLLEIVLEHNPPPPSPNMPLHALMDGRPTANHDSATALMTSRNTAGIDGRLTSTWNWCSKIEKKPYYRVFQMAGFTTFDGDWRSN
jgi:hypothetical protein